MPVKKTRLSWNQIHAHMRALAKRIPKGRYSHIYGIPKNGTIAAHLLSQHTGIPVLHTSARALRKRADKHRILVFDDLVDSGSTLKRFQGHPTAVIFDKHGKFRTTHPGKRVGHTWIVFPWEENEREGVADNLIRLLESMGVDVRGPGLDAKVRSLHRHVKTWTPDGSKTKSGANRVRGVNKSGAKTGRATSRKRS